MKTTMLVLALVAPQLCHAYCGVFVKDQKVGYNYIGYNELQTRLEKRGYYTRSEGYEDIELEIEIKVHEYQVCSEGPVGFFANVADIWRDIVDPLSNVEIVATYPKENRQVTLKKGLKLYGGNGSQVRRAINKLIRTLPKCKSDKE